MQGTEGKTISDEKFKEVTAFIAKHFEPRVEKMVKALNEYLGTKLKVRVGVELKWFYDEVKEKTDETTKVV